MVIQEGPQVLCHIFKNPVSGDIATDDVKDDAQYNDYLDLATDLLAQCANYAHGSGNYLYSDELSRIVQELRGYWTP